MDDLRTLEEARRWLRKMYLDGRDMHLCAIELDAVHDVLVRFDALVKRAEIGLNPENERTGAVKSAPEANQ